MTQNTSRNDRDPSVDTKNKRLAIISALSFFVHMLLPDVFAVEFGKCTLPWVWFASRLPVWCTGFCAFAWLCYAIGMSYDDPPSNRKEDNRQAGVEDRWTRVFIDPAREEKRHALIAGFSVAAGLSYTNNILRL